MGMLTCVEGVLQKRPSHQFSRMPLTAGCTPLYCGNSSLLVLIRGRLKTKIRYFYNSANAGGVMWSLRSVIRCVILRAG